jgi:hypothetical protein
MTRVVSFAGVGSLVLGLALAPRAGHAHAGITPPPMPDKLQVGTDEEAFLVGHAIGTQNYVCVPSGAGFGWSLFTPEATLFTDNAHQVTTHFFGPNPEEDRIVRAAWEHSKDSSTVWGFVEQPSTERPFVADGAIPWLLVKVSGRQAGPTGGDKLVPTTHIQRLNTQGGLAPADGCAVASDVGRRAFMPYTADYFFYRLRKDEEGQ